MSTIPDDLRQVIRELEKIQEVRERSLNDDPEYKKGELKQAVLDFLSDVLDDAIKILNDAEERIVMLEGRKNA